MSQNNLETRVAALEEQVKRLIRSKSRGVKKKDWHSSIGMFAGNELMKEIDAAGAAIRERERRQARRRPAAKRRRSKS
ncbi:MAG: hypothetical protein HY290_32055 [Planctomycetia bacterium]|nr:hypothetical protein [Planctomycetia bacterium]